MICIFGCICFGSILFSFVLNALSYIREGTVRYLWLGGGGGGEERFIFKISGNGGFIFQMQQNSRQIPLSKIKQF